MVYLDNAATTRVCPEAAEAAVHMMTECFGNPSTTYKLGREAKAAVDKARGQIAKALGCQPDEVYFTSCGSEGDNWALISGARYMRRRGKHIISSAVEHDAVRKSLDFLEKEGYEITRLQPDGTGAIPLEAVRAALRPFVGEILQTPPMYSAIKVNGQKLYDLARQGREVARKPRMITIFDLTLTQNLGNGQYALRIVCSKGTYIRTLCHDLGQALGCGGCMAALRRTEASNFRIDEAVTLEDVQREGEALLHPTDSLFRQYPAYTIPSTEQERKCLCGNSLRAKLPNGLYRVYGRDGAFLALSEAKDGTLTSKRNFFSV